MEKELRFCLSDDSHGADQVALNYGHALPFLNEAGITTITFLQHYAPRGRSLDSRFPTLDFVQMQLDQLRSLPFWTSSTI